MTNSALATVILADFVYFQLERFEPASDALEMLEGTVNVYPASAVDLEVADDE